MFEVIYNLREIGNFSMDMFWFPLAIWTICCGIAFLILRNREGLNPLFHYHLRTAALLSLPFGIAVAAVMSQVPKWFTQSNIETAFFVVQNPIELVPNANNATAEISINWMDPTLLIGISTVIIVLISLFMLGRLISSYMALKLLYKNLKITELEKVVSPDILGKKTVKLAFHDHPLVPFTFGWKQPVIVLPDILQHEPEKMDMALQHELIHIKRGDYLLQLVLSMIESVFWFHPLIRYGNQEIDTYREISCDQEVLSKSDFSIKSYANLLYELVPLSNGAGRLSVSMAVKNSTLKKRIKTMKYHKLHKASFRQSIAFLLLMIIGITLPIACSDLRGPQGLSDEELANTEIIFNSPTVTVNDIEVITLTRNVKDMAFNGFLLVLGEYGSFVFSPQHFDGSKRAGSISDNTATIDINNMTVKIVSTENILEKNSSLYARHFAIENAPDFKIFTGMPSQMINNSESLEDFATLKVGPPKPPVPSKSEDKGDYFVAVEEMPKLKGGMASLQSQVQYPEMARRAGIEGRVTIQFIVNESGNVENPKIIRGIGGGADEEALRVVSQAQFEPGLQRGKAVRVQYALSINFRLENSDYQSVERDDVRKDMSIEITSTQGSTITGRVTDSDGNPLVGANVLIEGINKGTATRTDGTFSISNVEAGDHTIRASFIGFKNLSTKIEM